MLRLRNNGRGSRGLNCNGVITKISRAVENTCEPERKEMNEFFGQQGF
ncbi:hypothetical protein [Methanosarcina sp. MSH10X1]|nr:hypothetical protein [Methanosarcina sp. MSH10X1]